MAITENPNMNTNIEDMSDEDLNVRVCEWLGWKLVETPLAPNLVYLEFGTRGEDGYVRTEWVERMDINSSLPNHVTGIEALGNMALAEARLTDDQHTRFRGFLWVWAENEYSGDDPCAVRRLHTSAPARQRAIALLNAVEEHP